MPAIAPPTASRPGRRLLALAGVSPVTRRGVKTTARRRVKDLDQGALPAADPLGADPADDEPPQYPTVLQGAKSNMAKFDNCVLLTRVGNFYELYFDHAAEYGPLLGLKVGHKQTKLGPVPMAGFPFFQLDRFLKTLVHDLNRYVAICEEFLIPVASKVKAGGLKHDRHVTRVVTPGTLIDEKFLDPYANNFLLSIHPGAVAADPAADDTADDTAVAATASSPADQPVGLAWLDLSTGDFFTQTVDLASLPSAVTRIDPREIVLPAELSEAGTADIRHAVGPDQRLLTHHRLSDDAGVAVATWDALLAAAPGAGAGDSAGAADRFTAEEQGAGRRLLDYVRARLQGLQLRLQPPRHRELDAILHIDRQSLRGLEILETARDGLGRGSLFHAVKRTVTTGGARLLRDRLTAPSASLPEIDGRLDLVTTLVESEELQAALVHRLRRTCDVQRIVQKFALNKGDADDMLSLATAIAETMSTRALLEAAVPVDPAATANATANATTAPDDGDGDGDAPLRPHPLRALLDRLDVRGPAELQARIVAAIDEEGLLRQRRRDEDAAAAVAAMAHDIVLERGPDELPALPKAVRTRGAKVADDGRRDEIELEEPWIMRRDASETLARLHGELAALEAEKVGLAAALRRELAAPTLSLRSTPGLGHVCHIRSATGFDRAQLEARQARMVSSSKSTRSFYLADWTRLGRRIDRAVLDVRDEERRLLGALRDLVIQHLVTLRRNAAVMNELDVAGGFAALAREQAWVRPRVHRGLAHRIIGGRHPTVTLGLEAQGRSFVSNSLVLDRDERVWLVTGPNMGGKSTFLRQNALITILAQAGAYVPAAHAEIGLVDRLFSRIGAADDLFRDQSTFMVEMLETAAILRHATARSFVIMDEVGRGTTPEDGTAVGYASLHHLYHRNRCRTLFATHFHALADMTRDWPGLACYCTDVVADAGGSFAFVHRLRRGVNRQSHALKVAQLAGLPPAALAVAEEVLARLAAAPGGLQSVPAGSDVMGATDATHGREDASMTATG